MSYQGQQVYHGGFYVGLVWWTRYVMAFNKHWSYADRAWRLN